MTLPSPCVTMRLGAGSAFGIGSFDGALLLRLAALTNSAAATQRMAEA